MDEAAVRSMRMHRLRSTVTLRCDTCRRSRQRARQRIPTVASMAATGNVSVDDLWRRLDADRSGTVDLGEIQKLIKQLGAKMKKQEIKKMLAEVDADGDGEISRAEFEAFWVSRDTGKQFAGSCLLLITTMQQV
eukprot:SAG31_NODE_6903_length_1857_cov_1.667235_2_plen_134_part_00